jgi:hypothetical protein
MVCYVLKIPKRRIRRLDDGIADFIGYVDV